MLTVGLDVHQAFTAACVLDDGGRVVRTESIRGGWRDVVEWVASLDRMVQVCFEASIGYGPLHDGLRTVSNRVVVAHPGQVRLIFRSKQKNDRAMPRSWRHCCSSIRCRRCMFPRRMCVAGDRSSSTAEGSSTGARRPRTACVQLCVRRESARGAAGTGSGRATDARGLSALTCRAIRNRVGVMCCSPSSITSSG